MSSEHSMAIEILIWCTVEIFCDSFDVSKSRAYSMSSYSRVLCFMVQSCLRSTLCTSSWIFPSKYILWVACSNSSRSFFTLYWCFSKRSTSSSNCFRIVERRVISSIAEPTVMRPVSVATIILRICSHSFEIFRCRWL